MRKSGLLVLSIITAFSVASVYAETLLPESSYYDGRVYEGPKEDGFRIDFAVYDTDTSSGNPFAQVNPFLEDDEITSIVSGRYVYAYQIFNNSTTAGFMFDFFAVLGIGEGALTGNENIDFVAASETDPGAEPSAAWVAFGEDEINGKWDWDAPVSPGEYSFILLLGSDSDWQTGDYTFNPGDERLVDDMIVVPEDAIVIPEPCTLALLTIGGGMLLRNRRRKTL